MMSSVTFISNMLCLLFCVCDLGIKIFKSLMIGVAQKLNYLCPFDVIKTWTGQWTILFDLNSSYLFIWSVATVIIN